MTGSQRRKFTYYVVYIDLLYIGDATRPKNGNQILLPVPSHKKVDDFP